MPEAYSKPENINQNSQATSKRNQPSIYTGSEEEKTENLQSGASSQVAGRMTGTMEELERMQETEYLINDEVRECIQDCLDCFKTCNQTLIRCLSMNGKHVEVELLNLVMDCARICNTNADFMLRNSMYHPQTCGLTADICDECGDVCDRFDEDFMKECAGVCRRCAESCREMAR
ncbi:MAG: four-helix bundle copper-binding protein [Candidatus Bathyarchaeia archaeon]